MKVQRRPGDRRGVRRRASRSTDKIGAGALRACRSTARAASATRAGTATIELDGTADGVDADATTHSNVQVGGKIAAVGQRLLEQVGKMMMKQALEALERELRARLRSEAGR